LAASLRRRPLAICGFSVVQFTIPMLLIAEAERTVPSSLVGCLIATEPLWIALLARRMSGAERTGAMEAVGMLAGLAGVGILLGVDFGGGLAGAALALGAAAAYALATLVIPSLTRDVPLMHLVAVGLAISALTLLPLVMGSPPDHVPEILPVAAVIGLAIAGTALAFPLWFALIVRVGPARAALVTYTSPVVAVMLGILLLGEEPGRFTPLGLALILGGSWMASYAASRQRAREVTAALGCFACPGNSEEEIGPSLTGTSDDRT
jgi:drug/metabolite transporter (DMT)-like permease